MQGFHDVNFPTGIARGAVGGPMRKTEIVTLASGHEQRNARWAHSRRRYNASYGIKTLDDLNTIVSFFEARMGRLHAFRFRDPVDFKSCLPSQTPSASDQVLGVGDATRTVFQLLKSPEQMGGLSSEAGSPRAIHLPRLDTLMVAVDGQEKVMGTDFEWDHVARQLSFQPSSIPQVGATITAGYCFDVPVRFDADEITTSITAFEAGEIPAIPLVEVML